jgi:transposase
MHVIGEDTAERLDVIPAQYRVIVTIVTNMAAEPANRPWSRPQRRND